MKVLPFIDTRTAELDAYVLSHPEGTVFHLTAWKRAIEREFGFESRYLIAERSGSIEGVLPLFRISNWMQGTALISTPFADYGGICATGADAAAALRNAACRMAVDEGVGYLELRESRNEFEDGFLTKSLYVSFAQELDRDPEKVLRGFPKDTRYMIRKGQKNGLRAVTDNSQIDALYQIYSQSVRNLGTPVFSKRFFNTLMAEFGEAAEITVVWHEERALAAVLSFRFRDAVLPHYGGSLLEGRNFAANNFMYWDVLRRGCEKGLRTFDFGRSKRNTGSYFFKTQWNMSERPLPYQYYLVKRKTMPDFSPINPRFKLATNVWKRVPLQLTTALGPSLVRLFP
jgi:FemAB-related protein (PEP-CTERM system-associated)